MKRLSIVALAAGLTLGLAGSALAQAVGIATDQPGSLGHNTGQAVAKVLNLKAHIAARPQPMAGTAAYIPLINRGEVEFGFCNAVEAQYAFSGTGNFDGKAHPDLRMIGVMFPLRTGLMATADSGLATIADVKARSKDLRIASDYTASSIIAYYIAGGLANGGMTYDDFKKVPVSNFVQGMQALGDNLVDVTLISLNSAAGKKVNAQLQSRGGIQYISLDDSPEGQTRFKNFLPAASIIAMKANDNIPGLAKPANIIQIPWVMLTHKDAPEDLVYRVTKTIAENNDALKEAFGAFRLGKAADMAPAHVMPYHPGALKYYEEAGIKVGD